MFTMKHQEGKGQDGVDEDKPFMFFVSLNMLLKQAPDLEDLQNIVTKDLVFKVIKCDLLPAKKRGILLQKEF